MMSMCSSLSKTVKPLQGKKSIDRIFPCYSNGQALKTYLGICLRGQRRLKCTNVLFLYTVSILSDV